MVLLSPSVLSPQSFLKSLVLKIDFDYAAAFGDAFDHLAGTGLDGNDLAGFGVTHGLALSLIHI